MDQDPAGTTGDAELRKRVRRNRQVVFTMLVGWLVLVLVIVSVVYLS